MENELIIGNKKYKVEHEYINQKLLKFYPQNPRIYSALNIDNEYPEQNEIEKIMCEMEHVKQLKESIKANGGLIDPLIIRDGDFIVLEGNSRLAAYRILAGQDPIKWGKVKCMILPSDISDSAIFTLIGQYHIVGRKDWNPYEQAGYLYRRIKSSNQSIESVANELGLAKGIAENYINVYSYMLIHADNHSNKWSYYEELLKNRGIKKYMDTVDGLEERIVQEIKDDKISRALDIRNVLGGIAKIKDKETNKVMKQIAEGVLNIYDGYKILEDEGKISDVYQTLIKFRRKITESNFKERLKNEEEIGQIKFELGKINKTIKQLLEL